MMFSFNNGKSSARLFITAAYVCRWVVVGIGVAGVIGVLFNCIFLRAFFPNTIPLSFTGSICFIISGLALGLKQNSALNKLTLFVSGLFLCVVGGLTLAEYGFSLHIFLDEIFVKAAPKHFVPGRMSISGSFNFLVAGLMFLAKWSGRKIFTEIPAIVILVVASIVATANLLYSSEPAAHPQVFTQPINGTIAFIAFATASIYQRPCCGFISTFASKAHTAKSGFILLNLILLIVASLTFFEYYGVRRGWFSFYDSLPVLMVVYFLVFAFIIERFTRLSNKYEKQKEMLFEEVQTKNEEAKTNLRELANYLQNSREEESMHLAREIHDQLGQELTIMKFHVNMLKDEMKGRPVPSLDMIARYLDGSLDLVKKISTELRPQLLDDIGLLEAIQWYANEVQRTHDIDIVTDLEVEELPELISKSTAIFRIFQEMLSNAARHANANQIYVHISRQNDPDSLRISITDDGIGFDPTQIKTHRKFGLAGMQERVYALKGTCQIMSNPGEGTCIIVEIPII